jgi:thiamine monophosphate kinase
MMRIVVKFPSRAYAELLADLEQIPPRERAERVRLLASVGMTVLRSGTAGAPAAGVSALGEDRPTNTTVSGFRRVRDRLTEGMLG